jgi:hypothetical protein
MSSYFCYQNNGKLLFFTIALLQNHLTICIRNLIGKIHVDRLDLDRNNAEIQKISPFLRINTNDLSFNYKHQFRVQTSKRST